MGQVEPGYASWLAAAARYQVATISGAETYYPSGTIDTAIASPLAYKADAIAEAVRQSQFLAGPTARDTHIVYGDQVGLLGQLVTITGDRLGYEDGRLCFVIDAQEDKGFPRTTLTVLTRLDL